VVEFKEGVAVPGGRSWGTNRTVAAVRLAYIDDSGYLSSARSYASVVCKVIGVCHLQGHRHPSTNYLIALHVICLRVQHDVQVRNVRTVELVDAYALAVDSEPSISKGC